MATSFSGDLVGRVLGNRYRLLTAIGLGSSARVYLADDVKLRRRVAVKVLNPMMASDANFLARFQHEAQSLAHLSHPNIVTVYDVNDGENALAEPPYLVTEYLAGGSLLNMLDMGYRLSPSQAVVVGLDAARGLQFAHARGLVHRDIKPANLLFGDDQRVRIADFGLARAIAEFGATRPSGVFEGTARYISPEQTKEQPLDGRSDVYSLALVLVEALTGTVPFSADTLLGTAFARVDKDLAPPEGIGALGEVIAAAGRHDPAERVDAAGLVAKLEEVAKTLPRAEPFPLDGSALAGSVGSEERDPTQHVSRPAPIKSPKDSSKPAVAATAKGADGNMVGSKKVYSVGDGGVFDIEAAEAESDRGGQADSSTDDAPEDPIAKRKKRQKFALLSGLAVVLLAGGGTTAYVMSRTPTHVVPTLQGLTLPAADQEVIDEKFIVRPGAEVYSSKVPEGKIVTQRPAAGTRVKEGESIFVTLSKGVQPVKVDSLTGLTFDQAIAVLRSRGLKPIEPPQLVDSETVPEGQVVDWDPKGEVDPGSSVFVKVSSGPPTVEIPSLNGMLPDDALAAVPPGITAVLQKQFADKTPAGKVIGSSPKAGETVPKGTEIKILVSIGPELVVVPNVINKSPAEASAILKSAGFKVGSTVGPPDMPVLHTRPIRNTKAKRGAAITLYTIALQDNSDTPVDPNAAAGGSSGTSSGNTPTTVKTTASTKPATTKPATTKPATTKPATTVRP